tara:strand:- start:45 stop:914 length:870 start_codon:yes stop_codon:yes gene_type:complete
MAIYFDQNGNLVDTEINESSNVFMEDPTENFYQPRADISPTQDFYPQINLSPTQNFYPPQMDISPTQDFYQPREFVNAPQNFYPPDLTTLRGLDMNKFQGVSDMSIIDETTNDEQDQNYIDAVNKNKESGIMKLIKFLIPGSSLGNFLPTQDPRATGIRNFYRPYEGLTSTGSIASGIMKGYNPVSGGFLNMITGGKYGKPTQYGLAGAMQRRIENILGRKAPQTDASRAKIAELRNLQRAEMEDRFDRGESLGSIGRSTFTGPGMAFEKQSGGVSGKGTANERNYGGR